MPEPEPPTGDFITIDGIRLHYRIVGEGPKVVALHGASGNLRDWTAGPARVLTARHTALLFDRPGAGHSDRPERGENIFVQAALMRRAAAELGFGGAPLVGHSFGGSVALAWAVDAPDGVPGLLLLAAPSQVWPGGVGALYHFTANPVTGPVLTRLVPPLAGDNLVTRTLASIFAPQDPPPGYADGVDAALALQPAAARNNARDVLALKDTMRRMVPRYDRLTMPVELLHGDADTIVPLDIHSARSVDSLPDARLTILPGIGHMPHHAAPDAMAAALDRLRRRAGLRG
ncbi:MAG: alpha/beta hydrolase [Pseudomonadota bacterium]